eukprot:TRINITY_DN61081_c0_g1_i3.p1 TRINITY_DN61081_c0_g1~~TRINITY_DN61081_c0_g1_i3.p1  ORF type:complete len:240 (+),score=41.13 TRINITY_DN61081_c0_g1_i3:72-791(+)
MCIRDRGISVAFVQAQVPCTLQVGSNTYDLSPLRMSQQNPFVFFDASYKYMLNFCGAPACTRWGAQATPGCRQMASDPTPNSETTIGSYGGTQMAAPLDTNDISGLNLNAARLPHQQPFSFGATTGIKLHYFPTTQQPNQPAVIPWSPNPLTVFLVCNPQMRGQNARPIPFSPGKHYRTSANDHLFAVESFVACSGAGGPVSYTHLRAHETPEHLVCRLLLEKKKKHPPYMDHHLTNSQ